jgi:hypothetical protein
VKLYGGQWIEPETYRAAARPKVRHRGLHANSIIWNGLDYVCSQARLREVLVPRHESVKAQLEYLASIHPAHLRAMLPVGVPVIGNLGELPWVANTNSRPPDAPSITAAPVEGQKEQTNKLS